MVGVQQWAEIRRLVLVEGCSQREVAARLGLARDTVARAVRLETPPKYSRVRAGSKLDPFREWDGEQLRADPRIPAQRLREMAGELGYVGGKTIFDDYVREVRPPVRAATDVSAHHLSPRGAGAVRPVGAVFVADPAMPAYADAACARGRHPAAFAA